jgi:hypothetical protein
VSSQSSPAFTALDGLEARLATRRFLVGERLTEADLRLFPTRIRFDVAYYGALRCNLKRLADYPRPLAYTKRILAMPGVAATVKLDHVKRHYWGRSREDQPAHRADRSRRSTSKNRWQLAPPDPRGAAGQHGAATEHYRSDAAANRAFTPGW